MTNLLFLLATALIAMMMAPMCEAQIGEPEAAPSIPDPPATPTTTRKVKGRKKGKKSLVLAEAGNAAIQVRVNEAKEYQAGDYYVWSNDLWSFDEKDNVPTDMVGTSRGSCVLLVSGVEQVPGHCMFTLAIHGTSSDDKEIEEDKLMVMGDVDDMHWITTQTLAVVGGIGQYEGAAGAVDIISESGFFIYEIYLD